MLRLLAKRHHDLVAARTRAVCRLHTTLCYLAEGHFPQQMTTSQGAAILARIRPRDAVSIERKALARDLLAEMRRADRDIAELRARIKTAVAASGSTVTEIHGVGPVVAAYLLGHTGQIRRFPSAGHYARYNGTAPIEASSGPTKRHRLNPRGNRQLNHALHIAAVTQVRNDTPGRAYYLPSKPRDTAAKKPCEHSSDASATPSTASSSPTPAAEPAGPGGQARGDYKLQRGRLNPEHRHFRESHSRTQHHATTTAHEPPSTRPHPGT